MWRSKARAFLIRSSAPRPPIRTQVALETRTLAVIPPSPQPPSNWFSPTSTHFPSLRFHSSASSEAVSREDDAKNPSFDPSESHHPSVSEAGDRGFTSQESGGIGDDAGFGNDPNWKCEESDGSLAAFDDGVEKGDAFGESSGVPDEAIGKSEAGGDDLSSLWEENISNDDPAGSFASEDSIEKATDVTADVDIEQIDSVQSLLRATSEEPIESSLEVMGLEVSEEFVAKVLQTPLVSAQNLIGFFKWASKNDESVRTSRTIELLVNAVGNCAELNKKEAYVLWDLVKEIGNEKGVLNTEILNCLISIFWKLGKAKAGLEVFNKFDEFGCNQDGNTFYFTIEALSKRSMLDTAWSVCEKMLQSGSLPDGEKIGKIIAFFCKGRKLKEAHLVYSMAKENNIYPPRTFLDCLIGRLAGNDETVCLALELLEDYSVESIKYANKSFASVVQGLCKIKDLQQAKKLLLRMVDSGPAPGNAVFNYVITALSKAGEMDDAVALMKLMDSRGLRPDIYTYSVIMSGFAKGGLMDEAYKIFCEAKKRHAKLSPVTYHILIRGYCKMEEFEKALECLKEMKDDGVQPNADEYDKLIQSLCLKAFDWCTAEKLLEEMKESGLHLRGITRSLIAAVKELVEEETQSGVSLEA